MAYHAKVAKNLAEGNGFSYSIFEKVEINPGLPYLIASGFVVFGKNQFWPSQFAIWLMGIGALIVFYRLFTTCFDRPSAVLIVTLIAANKLFLEFSHTLLTDIPFVFGESLFLLGVEQIRSRKTSSSWSILWIIFGIAMMSMFRSSAITVFAAATIWIAGLCLKNKQLRKNIILPFSLVATAYLITRWFDPRQTGMLATDEWIAFETLKRVPERFQTHIIQNINVLVSDAIPSATLGISLGLIGGLFFIAVFIAPILLYLKYSFKFWLILIGLIFLQSILFFVAPRHLLPLTPLFACGWWHLCVSISHRHGPEKGYRFAILLLILWLAPNVMRGGNNVLLEQHLLTTTSANKAKRIQNIKMFGDLIKKETPENSIILTFMPSERSLSYYSDRDIPPRYLLRKAPGQILDAIAERPVFLVGPVSEEDKIWVANHLGLFPATTITTVTHDDNSSGMLLIPLKDSSGTQ